MPIIPSGIILKKELRLPSPPWGSNPSPGGMEVKRNMPKIYAVDKIALSETVKRLRNEAHHNMDRMAELRMDGQITDYSPRDFEMVAQAYSNMVSVIADFESHHVEITE